MFCYIHVYEHCTCYIYIMLDFTGQGRGEGWERRGWIAGRVEGDKKSKKMQRAAHAVLSLRIMGSVTLVEPKTKNSARSCI